MVRCKFECVAVTARRGSVWNEDGSHAGSGILHEAEFQVVTGGGDENKKFFASTPGGILRVTAVRSDLFTPGKQYYLDITEATA